MRVCTCKIMHVQSIKIREKNSNIFYPCKEKTSCGDTDLSAGEVKGGVLHGVLQREVGFRAAHQQL